MTNKSKNEYKVSKQDVDSPQHHSVSVQTIVYWGDGYIPEDINSLCVFTVVESVTQHADVNST